MGLAVWNPASMPYPAKETLEDRDGPVGRPLCRPLPDHRHPHR
jgi:hypothetical protein